jgi:hypothetical protein
VYAPWPHLPGLIIHRFELALGVHGARALLGLVNELRVTRVQGQVWNVLISLTGYDTTPTELNPTLSLSGSGSARSITGSSHLTGVRAWCTVIHAHASLPRFV